MRKLLGLLVAVFVLSPAISHADFTIDDFTVANGDSFDIEDEFGNNYSVVRSSTSNVAVGGGGFNVALFDSNPSGSITWTFSPAAEMDYYFPIKIADNGTGLFYSNLLTFNGGDMFISPDTFDGIQNGNYKVPGVDAGTGGSGTTGGYFFDLTNLEHVSTLNGVQTLTMNFAMSPTAAAMPGSIAILTVNNAALIATPEPASILSLGCLALMGLTVSHRRRRRDIH